MRSRVFVCATLAATLLLTGCSEETVTKKEAPVRAIKSIVIKERAKDQLRRISGVVEAETVTDLSFEISGQLVKLNVETGARVVAGTIVALLDTEPYQLRVDTARGELESAQATLADANEKYKQQKILLGKGFTTKTSYDSATANLKTAQSKVSIARTGLSITERDLFKTKLIAPFDGEVAKRYVDVFTEVASGTPVIQLNSEGGLNVEASVPEGMIRRLSIGDRVSLAFPTLETLSTEGTISEIGSRAEAANAFPVKIVLDQQFPELRPGMSAEVTFRFATDATGRAFLIPMTAILPRAKHGEGTIFVFDQSAGIVRPRMVNILNVRDNQLEIAGDIKTGEIIATAGISFLADGMKVRLLEPEQAQAK